MGSPRLVLLVCLLLPNGVLRAAPVGFARKVLPILSDKCFVCHGPDTKDAEMLRLDTFEAATADRGGYRAIDPEHPEKSRLLERITDPDDPMPPAEAQKQLTEREREVLKQWIAEGGKYAVHWAFVRPEKAEPKSDESNPIDGFIADGLATAGETFAPEADRRTLARRAALVLTGLPPEPEQLRSFLADESDDAYESFVDQLLASPRYGEHQARYWLDAVRYGDTHGLHLDNRRAIHPYRDWVVRAFNENLPLDDFLVWQIAGDLLPEPTLAQTVATGFVRMNPTTSEGGVIPAEFQAKNNFDRVETLGTVLLGMTLTCARCHTHKYDPVPQTEYYRLLAFFNSTAESPLDGNAYEHGPVAWVPRDQPAWEEWPAIERERDTLLATARVKITEDLPDQLKGWDGMDAIGRLRKLAEAKEPFATLGLHDTAVTLLGRMSPTLVARELPNPRETKLLHRGEYDQPRGEPLEPGILTVMGAFPEDAPRNRLGLARWLTSREHPLVSRVLVNRLWQRVYGHGLVRTPEDFGLQGQHPTHPELLDWLAVELHDSEWDVKRMLRLMVTSRTFEQSSARRRDVDDPENRRWARGPSHRLDAEVIRDTALSSSGLLDRHMGGEGVKPYQPAGMWQALAHPGSNTKQYVRDEGEKLYRRSLYVYWKRTSPHPMMTLFNAPDRESSCVRRSRTSTALQSLALLNETQRIEVGRKFAERLIRSGETDDERLTTAFELLACRPPNELEQHVCKMLLQRARSRYAEAENDALALLSIGDAPRDEKLPPAEVAAWTQVATTLLASDVAILLY